MRNNILSTLMKGTALMGAVTLVAVSANDAQAARFAGRSVAAFHGNGGAARPTFRTPAANVHANFHPNFHPNVHANLHPNVHSSVAHFHNPAAGHPRVLTSRDIHPHTVQAAHNVAHTAAQNVAHNAVHNAAIPGVYGRDRANLEHELRHDRDDHRWDRHDWAHWWDHDFRHRFSDSFGRWGEHVGLHQFDRFGSDRFGFHHFGDHYWNAVWNHGFRPFGDMAWRSLAHRDLPWWDRWWPAHAPRAVAARPYFGVLGGGGAPVGGDPGDSGN
jgi:hypothetical protein